MRIGILGAGNVGLVLARGFADLGHRVTVGVRDASKVESWRLDNPDVSIATLEQAAGSSPIVVLTVPGTAATDVLHSVHGVMMPHTIVIDTCDPFASADPVDSVLPLFTSADESLLERLQEIAPHARMVKAFNTVGAQYMVQPDFPDGPPSMFLCGDDPEARGVVAGLITDLGWDPVDVGSARSARVLEPMASLYCAIGYHSGEWNYAFRLLRGA